MRNTIISYKHDNAHYTNMNYTLKSIYNDEDEYLNGILSKGFFVWWVDLSLTCTLDSRTSTPLLNFQHSCNLIFTFLAHPYVFESLNGPIRSLLDDNQLFLD